jgi:hypothetical protein
MLMLNKASDEVINEFKLKHSIGNNAWALESEVFPDLFFDDQKHDKPNVLVFSTNQSPAVIDIKKSLESVTSRTTHARWARGTHVRLGGRRRKRNGIV